MEVSQQELIAFYLTGRRSGTELRPIDGGCRPALFSRLNDLSSLRYDFPMILNRNASPGWALLGLSRLVDKAVEGLNESPERDRIARHGYRLEESVRKNMASAGTSDFAALWQKAAGELSEADETVKDSASKLWSMFQASGEVVDVDISMPAKVVFHAWSAVQDTKAKAFASRAERLLLKLREILEAEAVVSRSGRTPERLMAAVGTSFAGSFDFDRFSAILTEAKPGVRLDDARRARIERLIETLEFQRFYPLGEAPPKAYEFAFDRCSDAIDAFNERHEYAVELAKALAVAELEVNGEYRDSVHDPLFRDFGANGLGARELAQLPDYLICTDAGTLAPHETVQLAELLAAGLPFKILVRTDDVLEPSTVAEGNAGFGLKARQIVNMSIGLSDVFVFQAGASELFQEQDELIRGLTYHGAALFSIYSGVSGHTGDVPAYLAAAAATESRVFPKIVYDPSSGADWASRMSVDENPNALEDWPVHSFAFEDAQLQSKSEDAAFTVADLMAMDDRYRDHFAIMPATGSADGLLSVEDALDKLTGSMPDNVPTISLVDDGGSLCRAAVDFRILFETRRCLSMWRSLQELGGIKNSYVERFRSSESESGSAVTAAAPSAAAPVSAPAAESPAAAPLAAEPHGDDPYIETDRCTSCNECTLVNPKMFAYNDLKQAYLADPDAGTYRQLVEAAEGCQVGIIHPGKPRNPKEPGLEDLIKRAAEFV